MAVYRQRSSKNWYYSVYDRNTGKRIVGTTGTQDRERALAVEMTVRLAYAGKTAADRLHAMIDALTGERRPGLALSGAWDAYEAHLHAVNAGLSAVTVRKRRDALRRLCGWAREKWPAAGTVEEVDRACAAAFAEWLAREGAKGKTRRNVIGDLGTVWEGLRRVRDGISNPWPLVRPGARDSGRGLPFTRDEERAVLRAADAAGKGWGLACRIARHTGLRYGDVARLKWGEVDFEAGVIRLRPAKTRRAGIEVAVPMCGALRAALEGARAESSGAEGGADAGGPKRRRGRPKTSERRWGLGPKDEAGARWGGTDADHVLPLHARFYPRPEMCGGPGAFAEVLRAAGLDGGGHTFHSWRHTFRTRLSEAGVSDEIAKRLGGWTEDATAKRYDHDGRAKEMAEAVERASG